MDQDADRRFQEYVAARSTALRRLAYLLCSDWHLAEDLVQSALTRAYRSWRRVENSDDVCPAGSLVWRAVYLELGYVPDDKTALPETIAAPTGQPANCVTDGQNPPPGATVTSLPAAH